jgi:hypothetical protein
MHIASHAKGDVAIYGKARDYLAMSAITSWPEQDYNWEGYWFSLAGPFVKEYNPGLYLETMRIFRWTYDLGRQASGAFYFPKDHESLDPTAQGVSLALSYTAPLKTLQITGAPRSKYAKDFTLPDHLWGTPADLAFFDTKHNKDFHKYGEEELIHIPWRQLPNGVPGYFDPGTFRNLDLNMLLKNVRHARCEVRTAAAKVLVAKEEFGEIERLLNDPDPRLRRAALDGIMDCGPWFTIPPRGRYALPAEKFTPGMIHAINRIMRDPDEAWFVIDGAMLALAGAPVEVIKENIPRIMPWTTHEDWWLRESAFYALMGLERDKALFTKTLPTSIDMMLKEYNYNPRHKMAQGLKEALVRVGNDSAAGKLIIHGFSRGPIESEVRPDVNGNMRSREGLTNVVEVAQMLVLLAPEKSADLAEALFMSNRLADIDTASLMQIVRGQDGVISDRFVGLYPALDRLPEQEKPRLIDLLYNRFRPELLKRLKAEGPGADGELLDMLLELTALKKPVKGWEAIGTPAPDERIWNYVSFSPLTEKDKLPLREENRYRKFTLPGGMDGWDRPNFDDSSWKSGKMPIGVGEFKANGHGTMWTCRPDFFYRNKSEWGDGEFLLARNEFQVEDLNYEYFRLRVLSDQGYVVFLNGHEIRQWPWFQHYPKYHEVILTQRELEHLKKGTNTLAVAGFTRFERDKDTQGYHPVGQMDLVVEGVKGKDLELFQ